MYQAIFFDLDGTLLPMDLDEFTNGYFSLLAKIAAPYGFEKERLVSCVWKGTYSMVKNDGTKSNRDRFWDSFVADFGPDSLKMEAVFDDFYAKEFNEAVKFTSPAPNKAVEAVRRARLLADKVVLATNPIFPMVGVETRLNWVGLSLSDFDYVTSYENSRYCKPNPKYYTEIIEKLSLLSDRCLMIGNDIDEDIIASQSAGLDCLLIPDCIINKHNSEINAPMQSLENVLK